MADALLLFLSRHADRRRTCAQPTAKAGKDGGFKNATFVEAGKRLRELAAEDPFQPGYLSTSHAQSAGVFGDGKAAMDLMGDWLLGMQAPNSIDNGKGLSEDDIGMMAFPTLPGRQGQGDRHAGRRARVPRHQKRAARGRRFPEILQSGKYAKAAAEQGDYIPVYKGAESRHQGSAGEADRRRSRQDDLSSELLRSGSRPLGRARVVNDISVSVAAGQMTPDAAAAAIQDAADQQ